MRNLFIAGLITSLLCACGGGSNPVKQASSNSASGGQIAVPASSPVAASSPAASDPASSTPSAASDSTASAPTAASAPASTPVVRIAVFGDDQMAGIAIGQYGMPTLVTPNEPAQLQALLQKQFNDTGITVQNISSGGTSSSLQNELDGMDGLGDGQPQRMLASGASIVIEEHAVNDALGGETVAEYSAYLGQWIQDAQAAGLQPVLEEPGPVCDGSHPQLPAYVAAMDAVAATYNVPLIQQYTIILAIDGWQTHMIGCTVPDSYLDSVRAAQEQAIISAFVPVIWR